MQKQGLSRPGTGTLLLMKLLLLARSKSLPARHKRREPQPEIPIYLTEGANAQAHKEPGSGGGRRTKKEKYTGRELPLKTSKIARTSLWNELSKNYFVLDDHELSRFSELEKHTQLRQLFKKKRKD